MIPDDKTDETDLRILDMLQEGIPLVNRPYAAIASRIGITETDLIRRVEKMHTMGILRTISPVIESRKMGLAAATLVALHVPQEKIPSAAAIISSYPEVSHNYRREHFYPIWFTISAPEEERVQKILFEILERTGISRGDALDLPTVRKFKIDVRFSIPAQEEQT
jgi:DNA-binding Lrp family transcriptional regulator